MVAKAKVSFLFIINMCALGNAREQEVEVTVERGRESLRGPYYYH